MIRFAFQFLVSLLLISAVFSAPVDPNFATDNIQFGFGKSKIEFDPFGRMLVAEKQGRVLQFAPDGADGFQAPNVVLDISAQVDAELESGLLGMALSPDFNSDRFIYLFYTTASDQRLVRYAFSADFSSINPASETILLSGLPRLVPFHNAGDIGIHPEDPGAIYVALGDDDRVNLAQNLDFYEGKILKVSRDDGLGLASNPFFNGDLDSIRSRVWSRGHRNPFRFCFHPTRSDVLLVSENGDSTDRVAWVQRGSNGEWGPGGDNGGFLSPTDPNFRVMWTGTPSLIGIAVIDGGPFAYQGQPTVFLGDWFPGFSGIRRFTLGGADLDTLTSIDDSVWEEGMIAVDLNFGPDGRLYFTETGGGESLGGWYGLRRYRFEGSAPPIAAFDTNPTEATGPAPLTIQFNDDSTAVVGSIVSWAWDFGDGGMSSEQNPVHTFETTGAFTVSLTVTDNSGLTSTATQTVVAYREADVSMDWTIFDGSTLPAAQLTSPFSAAFFQLDGVTPLAISGGIGPDGNEISISNGRFLASQNLQLLGPGFLVVFDPDGTAGFGPFTHGFEAPETSAVIEDSIVVSQTMIHGRLLTLTGQPVRADVGVAQNGAPIAIGGGRDFLEESVFPPTGAAHRIESDVFGYFHVPLPNAAPVEIMLNVVRDTNRDRFVGQTTALTITPSTLHRRDFMLGEWNGGSGADDLSAIPTTASVPFDSIQAIFSNQCTGCHRANTANNGGLDLTVGASFNELVDQFSGFVSGVKLVEPGSPSRSYLFEKINRANPQQGARMRPSEPMPLADQALIRDWILQLGPHYESFLQAQGVAPGQPEANAGEDADGDGVPNALQFSGPQLSFEPGLTPMLQLSFDQNPAGLTLIVDASEDLAVWSPIAARTKENELWYAAAGVQVEVSGGSVTVSEDSVPDSGLRFLRLRLLEN